MRGTFSTAAPTQGALWKAAGHMPALMLRELERVPRMELGITPTDRFGLLTGGSRARLRL